MPVFRASYGPDTVALMTAAFEAAWSKVQANDAAPAPSDAAQASMASSILAAVSNGERDPRRLQDIALRAVNGVANG